MTKPTKTKKPAVAPTPPEAAVVKKAKKAKASVTTEPVTAQESKPQLVLTEAETLKLRLFHSEQERFGRQYTLATIQRSSYLKQIDPNGQLEKIERDMGLASGSAEAARKQYQETIQGIEARLNIKLDGYSFDGNTGVLHKVE